MDYEGLTNNILYIKSNINGENLVQNLPDKQEAADLLSMLLIK